MLGATEKMLGADNPLGAPQRLGYPNIVVFTEGSLGPSPGAHARHAETQPFPSRIVMDEPSMKRRRNGDSDYEGDLVDPAAAGSDAPASASPNSQPQAHGPVYVGGGEREARAYVAPTAVPLIAAPKTSADKVAIASSVDPRRMQTIRVSPGRIRPPLSPDEQRPDMIAEEAGGSPSSRYPTSGAQPSQRAPKSAMASATIVRAPPPAVSNSGPPTIVWVLAVALAALIGAGVALWLRKNSTTPAPAPTNVPAKPASTTKR